MQFVLNGFTEDTGFRVFAFERIAADRTRTEFAVKADLALIRRYGIRVQELPLLCLGLLERRDEAEQACTLTFTEADMCLHADNCAAERDAAQRRKPRRFPTHQLGTAAGIPQP